MAYPFLTMGTEAVINDEVAGNDIVVIYYDREKLAIPYFRKIKHKDAERILTFERVNATQSPYPFMLKDRETESIWDLKGQAVSGELSGSQLTQVPAHNAFWFAWVTFWQNTGIY